MPPKAPLKPPQHLPTLTKIGLERLGVYGTRWMWVGVVGLMALWPLNPGPVRSGQLPTPAMPQVPLQEHTTDAVPHVLASMFSGVIPRPGNGQKLAGQCDPQGSEVELRGGCWIKTYHGLPCPENKQWEHEGHCYRPVFRAERPGTSAPRMDAGTLGQRGATILEHETHTPGDP